MMVSPHEIALRPRRRSYSSRRCTHRREATDESAPERSAHRISAPRDRSSDQRADRSFLRRVSAHIRSWPARSIALARHRPSSPVYAPSTVTPSRHWRSSAPMRRLHSRARTGDRRCPILILLERANRAGKSGFNGSRGIPGSNTIRRDGGENAAPGRPCARRLRRVDRRRRLRSHPWLDLAVFYAHRAWIQNCHERRLGRATIEDAAAISVKRGVVARVAISRHRRRRDRRRHHFQCLVRSACGFSPLCVTGTAARRYCRHPTVHGSTRSPTSSARAMRGASSPRAAPPSAPTRC